MQLEELGDDELFEIFCYLDPEEVFSTCIRVCSRFYTVAKMAWYWESTLCRLVPKQLEKYSPQQYYDFKNEMFSHFILDLQAYITRPPKNKNLTFCDILLTQRWWKNVAVPRLTKKTSQALIALQKTTSYVESYRMKQFPVTVCVHLDSKASFRAQAELKSQSYLIGQVTITGMKPIYVLIKLPPGVFAQDMIKYADQTNFVTASFYKLNNALLANNPKSSAMKPSMLATPFVCNNYVQIDGYASLYEPGICRIFQNDNSMNDIPLLQIFATKVSLVEHKAANTIHDVSYFAKKCPNYISSWMYSRNKNQTLSSAEYSQFALMRLVTMRARAYPIEYQNYNNHYLTLVPSVPGYGFFHWCKLVYNASWDYKLEFIADYLYPFGLAAAVLHFPHRFGVKCPPVIADMDCSADIKHIHYGDHVKVRASISPTLLVYNVELLRPSLRPTMFFSTTTILGFAFAYLMYRIIKYSKPPLPFDFAQKVMNWYQRLSSTKIGKPIASLLSPVFILSYMGAQYASKIMRMFTMGCHFLGLGTIAACCLSGILGGAFSVGMTGVSVWKYCKSWFYVLFQKKRYNDPNTVKKK